MAALTFDTTMRETTPARPAWGEGRCAADAVFAPADDRNALATTAGGIVLAGVHMQVAVDLSPPVRT